MGARGGRRREDRWAERARRAGYRARSAWKLLEIDDRHGLFRKGLRVVDIGSAPGGWSQVAAQRVGSEGRVVAVDILDMKPVAGVSFVRGDFRQEAVRAEVAAHLEGKAPGLVICDIAPNLTGVAVVDEAAAEVLALTALDFAASVLSQDGRFLLKCFHGERFASLKTAVSEALGAPRELKPAASKDASKEVYLLAGRSRGS